MKWIEIVFVPYRGKEIKNTVPRKPPNSTASEALCGWNRFLGFFICFPILFCRRNPLFIRCVAKLQKSVFFSIISKLNIHFKTKNVKFLFYFAFYYLIHIIVWIPVFVFCFYFCSYYQFFKHFHNIVWMKTNPFIYPFICYGNNFMCGKIAYTLLNIMYFVHFFKKFVIRTFSFHQF